MILIKNLNCIPVISQKHCIMVFLTFHYILTSFHLGVWIGYPRNIPWVMILFFLFQLIFFLSGRTILDDATYWGWQALAAFEGVSLASLFLCAYQSKHTFLEIKHRYERVWLTFFLSTAGFVGAQVIYTQVDHPYGILFCMIASVVVLLLTGYSLLFDNVVFESAYEGWGHKNLIRFIGLWILFVLSIEAVFFAQEAGLNERDLAFISGGGALFWAFAIYMFGYSGGICEASKRRFVF